MAARLSAGSGSVWRVPVSDHVARYAVLNANYILARLKQAYRPAFVGQRCMHECVFTAAPLTQRNIHAIDLAKALLDRGFHAPTVYFPLTVKESIMIEPTETESKETLDEFCQAMLELAEMIQLDGDAIRAAPATLPVGRLDEVRAARELRCASVPD
jgi:glycine dehydrogenase subunit 2